MNECFAFFSTSSRNAYFWPRCGCDDLHAMPGLLAEHFLAAVRNPRNPWARGCSAADKPRRDKAASAAKAETRRDRTPRDPPSRNRAGPPRGRRASGKDSRPPAAARRTRRARRCRRPRRRRSSGAPPSRRACAAGRGSRRPPRNAARSEALLHALLQAARKIAAAAFEKQSHVARGFGIALVGDQRVDARAQAAVNVILQAGPRMVARRDRRCRTAPENACGSDAPAE